MIPQNAAGLITDPEVWVLIGKGNKFTSTAAADPDEDPPGVELWHHGISGADGFINAYSAVTYFPSILTPGALRTEIKRASVLDLSTIGAAQLKFCGHTRHIDNIFYGNRNSSKGQSCALMF